MFTVTKKKKKKKKKKLSKVSHSIGVSFQLYKVPFLIEVSTKNNLY